jgi:hypothetical protein
VCVCACVFKIVDVGPQRRGNGGELYPTPGSPTRRSADLCPSTVWRSPMWTGTQGFIAVYRQKGATHSSRRRAAGARGVPADPKGRSRAQLLKVAEGPDVEFSRTMTQIASCRLPCFAMCFSFSDNIIRAIQIDAGCTFFLLFFFSVQCTAQPCVSPANAVLMFFDHM